MLYEADFDVYLLRARLVRVLIPSALAWPSVPDCECWHSGEHLTLSHVPSVSFLMSRRRLISSL